jgi:hypothetical protein
MTDEDPSQHLWQPGAPTWDGSWDRLARGVYAGVRDENLSPDAAFDMACFLMEWARPDPMFRDLAEAAVSGGDQRRLTDLARRVLAKVAFVPDFAAEPQLLATLERALAVVAADLRATGLDGEARLVVVEGREPPRAFVSYENGFGHTGGLGPSHGEETDPVGTLVLVADELQDAVMASLMAAWPVCPKHEFGAHPRTVGSRPMWWCTGGSGHDICLIGSWGR